MLRFRRRVAVPMCVALTLAAGCGGRDAESDGNVSVQFSSKTAEPAALDEGDVKITSTDGALVLAVVGDSVVMQLSDSLRASVSDSVKRGTDSAGGFGAIIGDAVKAAVNTAMGFRVRIPAKDVENLRYENGELRFDVRGGNVKLNTGKGKAGNGGAFAEADAQRFIEAVTRAQSRPSMQ